MAALFARSRVGSFAGGELFLAVMAGIGALMTLWVGGRDPLPRLSAVRPRAPNRPA